MTAYKINSLLFKTKEEMAENEVLLLLFANIIMNFRMLSHLGVTINRIWIGYCIY
jgi:hypothetical protein